MDIKDKKILMTLMGLEIGGAETHVLELSLELARQGFQVIVASSGGVYEAPLAEAGIKHYKVPMHTKRPDKVLTSLAALKRIIKKENIDIVHAHGRIPAFLCGLLHPFMNFTFVTTAHWVFRTNYGFKYLSNWGEKVMSVSEDIKTYLMDNYGTDPNDIYVTINGIDTNKFSQTTDFSSVLEEFSLQKESRKIVYISRMDEDRALVAFHLTEIAPMIDEAFPGTEIVIVGSGNVFDKLKALADEVNNKIGRRMVVLTGGRTDIQHFAAMSDLFVGVSRSALEAMSCAKPVIVAGNEGYLGIFDESKLQTGIDTNFCCRGLVQSTPELLLADVKAVLSADEAQKEHWGAYSREVICNYYSVSKMAADNVAMYCGAVNPKPWDVVISGYYGYGNSGDEALLSAMLKHLRQVNPELSLCVLSKNPRATEKAHGVSSINRYNYCKIKKAMKQAKLFISGGGSLLQDVTSSRSLRYYLFLIQTALRVGTRVMLYANGIGPVLRAKNRKVVKETLNKVSAITLREQASMEELASLGVNTETVLVTADPALDIRPADEDSIQKLMQEQGICGEDKLLGISVRPWKNCSETFEKNLAEAIGSICEKRGLTPVFLPMQYPEDYEISQRIVGQLPCKAHILPQAVSAQEMIGLISRMELLLAERLHSLIYAANAHVPTIGLSYDSKVDAFMDYIGIGAAISVETLTAKEVEEAVLNVYEHYDEIRKTLMDKQATLCTLAKKNAEVASSIIG